MQGQGRLELALDRLARRFALDRERLGALLEALAAEPDPPTTVRAPGEALERHLADSLVALEITRVREAIRLADIGPGAGFPGLPLAVALPDAAMDLIEAARRKGEVVNRLKTAAGVTNARVVTARAEEWAAGEGREAYDVVTARAVGSLPLLCEYAAPLLRRGGALVAWKGRRDAEEERRGAAAAGRLGLECEEVLPVSPFQAARDRHLHVIAKRAPTPPGFPRRAGRAAKRPLA